MYIKYFRAASLFKQAIVSNPFFWKFEFLLHEDSVYGNIVLQIKHWAVSLKIDYTLRCLEYNFSISSPLRPHGALATFATLGLLIDPRPLNCEHTVTCTLKVLHKCYIKRPQVTFFITIKQVYLTSALYE